MTNVTLSKCGARVTLDPTIPYAGKEITATLPDLDVTITGAQWQRRRDNGAWTDITSATNSAYTPEARDEGSGDEGDEGWQLRATVRYQAEDDVYPYAQSAGTAPVQEGQVPPKPTAGLLAMAGVNQITVGWDSVSATPAVSKYQVQYQRVLTGRTRWSDYVDQATVYHANSFYTHRNDAAGYPLHPGYRYRYRVRAQNVAGAGLWSEEFPTDGAIVQADAPGLAGLVLDDESVGLVANWTCPNYGFCTPSSVWSVAPLRLQAEIKSGSSTAWSSVSSTVSGEQTTHRVGGLDRGMVHQFRTRAVNLNGVAGRASEAIALVPLRTQTESGANWVALSWDQPDYAGLAWQYRYKTAASAMWGDWQEVSTSRTTPQTVSELTNGVSYQFQVRALSGTTARAVSFIESATAGTLPPETQSAYQISASGSNAPSFSATASGIPSGWSSSRQTPISTAPYEWRISRTRSAGGSWSNWGSATVVSTYPSPPETQSAYQISASGSNAPSFSATASGIPSGWSSSRQTPVSAAPYEWRIRRTRPAGGSWSNWGSATVVNTLTASTGIRFEPNTATRHIDVGETISYTFPFPTGAVGSTSYSYSLPSGATRFLHSFSWTAPDRGVSQYLRQLALPRRPQTARPPLHFVFSSMSLSTALPARYRDEPARNTA